MPNVKDRVKETTTTTGNGSVSLSGAAAGFQTFLSAFGNAVVTNIPYCIAAGAEFEVGRATFNGPALTLARDTVEASSNAGNLVVFSAGTKDVFCTMTALAALGADTVAATTRATTTDLTGESLNGTISDTAATIGAFNGVAGFTYHRRFLGAGIITNSAGLIITQGLADITTAAGDTCDVEMITATTSRVKNYVSSAPLVYARVQTANGYGSTNTKIRRFTTVLENTGIYVDSATLGAKFTIPVDGKYFIGYADQFNVGSSFGVSLNSTQLTTSINAITQADILMGSATSAGDYSNTVGVCVNLLAGDVIRPHTAGAPSGVSTWAESFIILRIA